MKNEEKITEIVSKEALAQVDELVFKLRYAVDLQKKLGSNNVTEKVKALSGLVNSGLTLNGEVLKLANDKLKELIPLL